jgi:hypothetical protein
MAVKAHGVFEPEGDPVGEYAGITGVDFGVQGDGVCKLTDSD